MALYKLQKDALSELKKMSFEKENMKEKELQTLLKSKIEVIAPDDIMVISEEFSDWEESGRRIDLLAVDKDANLVVIELKRSDGGHMELQAIRYAAMVSTMTWQKAVDIFSQYIQKNDADASKELCKFLGWEEGPKEEEFAQKVRIILVSENFSKEITTSVLWLNNEYDLDISCVRLSLHKFNSELVLSANQIIPLPEAKDFLIEVNKKKEEVSKAKNSKKDHSTFSILYKNEEYASFKKVDIAYHTVKLLQDKGLINDEVFQFLKDDKSCSFQLLKYLEEITAPERERDRYRLKKDPVITYKDKKYYVARNWGQSNIDKFIEKIENKFPKIKYIRNKN